MENDSSLEVKYTENALKRLDELKEEYVQRLEFHLKRRKYQKGKNYIEITSTDLDRVAKHYQYVRDIGGGMSILSLYVFFVIGLISTLTGFAWPYLADMLSAGSDGRSPGRISNAITLIGGISMIVISIALFYYMKLQEREKRKEKEKRNIKS